MSNSFIWPIDRTLSDATIPGQSEPGSDGNQEVFCIHQSFCISGASLSDWLMSYAGHSFEKSYPSVEMQSVYSEAPTYWDLY